LKRPAAAATPEVGMFPSAAVGRNTHISPGYLGRDAPPPPTYLSVSQTPLLLLPTHETLSLKTQGGGGDNDDEHPGALVSLLFFTPSDRVGFADSRIKT